MAASNIRGHHLKTTLILLGAIAMMSALSTFCYQYLSIAGTQNAPVILFCVDLVGLLLVLAAIGLAFSNRLDGVFIDNRNRVSLSKTQMLLWLTIVLSFLASAIATNFQHVATARSYTSDVAVACQAEIEACKATGVATLGVLQAAATVYLPSEIVAAMGIALASAVGTPSLLSLKTTTSSSGAAVANAAAATGTPPSQATARGQVFSRRSARYAHWADIFRGDEVANAGSPDVTKIQQVLVTVLLMTVYVWQSVSILRARGPIVASPALTEQFIWLLGVSHASYLAYKAVPHTAGAGGDAAPSAQASALLAGTQRPTAPPPGTPNP